jgi:uncharacterized protein (DUF1697 family)
MPRYIAFLRAINVGGHVVKMDHLRRLFESLKLSRVETFIASGNVIFESAARDARALERKIEALLERELGYEVSTFLRTPSEVAAVAAHRPFTASAGARLYVAFLPEPLTSERQRALEPFRNDNVDVSFYNRELYWLFRNGLAAEFPGARIEKQLGVPMTMRNTTTVGKLAAKYSL